MEKNKQEWYSKLQGKLKRIESGELSLTDYISEVEEKLRQPIVSCRVCFSSDCFYHDKTTDTCVGDYAKCTVKQTHR